MNIELVDNTTGYRNLDSIRRYSLDTDAAGRIALSVNGQPIQSFKTVCLAKQWLNSCGYDCIQATGSVSSSRALESGTLAPIKKAKSTDFDPYDCMQITNDG